jgi:pimeloyl-ACP methyl ester carboxylesterase
MGDAGTDLFRNWFSFRLVPNAKQWQRKPIEETEHYCLAVIEFDDQGWFQDLDQRDALERFLKQKNDQNEDLLIVVFIHGWKHNAEPKDTSLQSFCSLLRDTCLSERHRRNRQILGVYLSWRGLSSSGNLIWTNASFWERKKAATKVALGCVREILAWLRAFQAARNQPNDVDVLDKGTRLIIAGHSFGGLILFTAVSEYLIESVVRCICMSAPVVRPFGDLIILINPAFEAARCLPLYSAARRAVYPENQRPCFLAVTSTNDDATKYWFPTGRWFSTRLESVRRNTIAWDDDREIIPPMDAQGRSILNTVGHLPWLTTHRLSCPKTDESTHQAYKGMGPDKPDWDKERQAFDEFNQTFRPNGRLREKWKRTYSSGAILEHLHGNPDNPFWTIEAAPEVVDGHNGIFGKVFSDFLRQVCDDRLQSIACKQPPV